MRHILQFQSKAVTIFLTFAILAFLVFSIAFSRQIYGQTSDHMTSDQSHLPTAKIGDRQLSLDFGTTPFISLPGDNIDMTLNLIDKDTNKGIPHVTYRVIINTEGGKQVFSEGVHGHDGKVSLRFLPDNSTQSYKVGANYDTLSASYVSDFGGPIKVQGPVFSSTGNYKISVEVIGIDFDNTSLQEPLKYDLDLPVLARQTLSVNYHEKVFQLGAFSSIPINDAQLVPEKNQLILTSSETTSNDAVRPNDIKMKIEIPKKLMSGTFSASNGETGALDVQEQESTNSQLTTLLLFGKYPDTVQSNASNITTTSSPVSIVITASTVIPEFPLELVGSISAIGFMGMILYLRAFKAYNKSGI